MKNLTYLLIMLGFTILTSCEKENNSSVEGYFYKDCSQTSIESVSLNVYGITIRSFQNVKKDFLGEVTIDNRGFFRLEVGKDKNYNGYDFHKGNRLFFGTSYETEKKFIAYDNAVVNQKVILIVDRPFTDQDTLFLGGALNDTILIVTGPFTNLQTFPISILPNIGTSSAQKYESFRWASSGGV